MLVITTAYISGLLMIVIYSTYKYFYSSSISLINHDEHKSNLIPYVEFHMRFVLFFYIIFTIQILKKKVGLFIHKLIGCLSIIPVFGISISASILIYQKGFEYKLLSFLNYLIFNIINYVWCIGFFDMYRNLYNNQKHKHIKSLNIIFRFMAYVGCAALVTFTSKFVHLQNDRVLVLAIIILTLYYMYKAETFMIKCFCISFIKMCISLHPIFDIFAWLFIFIVFPDISYT